VKDCEDCDGKGTKECQGSCNYCDHPCMEDVECEVCNGTGDVEEDEENE